jgi:uncharacterized iron-regulated membrane protein
MSIKPPYYNFFWRWHFYAGLFVTPIIFIMAVTGGLYLLQPQIEDLLYGDRLYLPAAYQGVIDHDALVQAAKNRWSARQVHSYQPPATSRQTAQVVLTTKDGVKLTVFLHPTTQQVLGTVVEKWRLMNLAREIHKGLMLGTPGRVITELAACWLIVMLATGFYLWWPRRHQERGVLVPNTHTRGRKLWREFHAVPGAWVGLWIGALLITGLPWSILWGGLLTDLSTRVGEGFPKAVFSARPHSLSPLSLSDAALPDISMNQLFQEIAQQHINHAFKIDYPWGPKGSYALMPLRHGGEPHNLAFLFFDRRSGHLLEAYRWDNLGKVGRLTSLGVAFHEGRLFGGANQLLNLTAVLVLISLCISGPVMWWKRKPQKALGAPRLPANTRLPKRIIAIIALVGILLPLFGASVLLILMLEKLTASIRKRDAAS